MGPSDSLERLTVWSVWENHETPNSEIDFRHFPPNDLLNALRDLAQTYIGYAGFLMAGRLPKTPPWSNSEGSNHMGSRLSLENTFRAELLSTFLLTPLRTWVIHEDVNGVCSR